MLGQDEALVRLARLKLAGIIVKTDTKPVPKTEAPLDLMVDRLANLFEDYLSQKTTVVAPGNRLTTTIIEEQL